MASNVSPVRKFITSALAAGSLLAVYSVSTVAVTGAMLTATTTSAEAQWRGRGWRGRGRGWRGRGRGWRGRRWVCRHHFPTSGRRCFWAW